MSGNPTTQTDFDNRYVPANTVLVVGGHGIEDTIMDLLALWELADNDPQARRAVGSISELVAAELSAARLRVAETETTK